MKIDRLNEYVLAITVVVVGIVLAVFCGRFAGTGDNKWIYLLVAAVVYVITCFTLRVKVWFLIPMCWGIAGQMPGVPLQLPVRDVIVAGVVAFFLTLKAFKIVRTKAVYNWLDMILALNILYIIGLYLRYPIGVNATGSDTVGGRAYAEVVVALGGYWVLNQVSLTNIQAKVFPLLLCSVAALQAGLNTITYLFPATVPIVAKFYNGIDAESYYREQAGGADLDQGDMRAQYLSTVGTQIISLMTSYFSPLTMINPMYIWRTLGMAIALVFCMKSGHRITIPAVAFTILITAYFRRGIAAVIILVLIAIPPMVLLIAGQGRLYNLPETAQRTLCMFPGNWDPEVLSGAENSTEWRVQMWDMMLHDDRYIHDKIFGDGFGFTRQELEHMAAGGTQEDFMLTNSPHSGPISTIRVGGIVGFGLFVLLLAACAVQSWGLIRATKGTDFYPVSLFIGVQAIYFFVGFLFVFGDFKNNILDMILIVGEVNLLVRSFNAWRRSIEDAPAAPLSKKTVQPFAPLPMPALH